MLYSKDSHPTTRVRALSYFEQVPHLARFYKLDRYLDPSTGWPLHIPSVEKWGDSSLVNYSLWRIHEEQWPFAYVSNRTREHIAMILMQAILTGIKIDPSSTVNDILYHTDAIMHLERQVTAIDFTENPLKQREKVWNSTDQGLIKVRGPDNRMISLPFLVIYIQPYLINFLGQVIDGYLLKKWKEATEPAVIDHARWALEDLFEHTVNHGVGVELYTKHSSLEKPLEGQIDSQFHKYFSFQKISR